jgi:hypothetical protein
MFFACKLYVQALRRTEERLHRKEEEMSTVVSCVIGAGFIAFAAIVVIHLARDLKAPSQGQRIHRALARLEQNLRSPRH